MEVGPRRRRFSFLQSWVGRQVRRREPAKVVREAVLEQVDPDVVAPVPRLDGEIKVEGDPDGRQVRRPAVDEDVDADVSDQTEHLVRPPRPGDGSRLRGRERAQCGLQEGEDGRVPSREHVRPVDERGRVAEEREREREPKDPVDHRRHRLAGDG